MQNAFISVVRQANKRSQSGQSILLIAFAFLALLSFVGITTDVALLFVRFSALRRAVDAASIAVAGQIRQGTDFSRLNAIARQFISLQGGIDPQSVKVETCETDIYNFREAYKVAAPAGDFAGSTEQERNVAAFNHLVDPTKRDAKSNGLFATGYTETELCKIDPQKLARVSAQLESPTAFLVLFGWRNVMLVSSAISQTATLDVALVIDASESMTYDTYNAMGRVATYPCGGVSADRTTTGPTNDCSGGGGGFTYTKTALPGAPYSWGRFDSESYDGTSLDAAASNRYALRRFQPFLNIGLTSNFELDGTGGITRPLQNGGVSVGGKTYDAKSIRNECMWYPDDGTVSRRAGANFSWGGCCNDPSVQANPLSVGNPSLTPGDAKAKTKIAYDTKVDWRAYITDDETQPEATIPPSTVLRSMDDIGELASPWYLFDNGGNSVYWNNGDGNYSDLLCQPFKQVRDAARRFINRLDFVRGDRLILVTFNKEARVIRPDFPQITNANPEPQDNISVAPVFLDKDDAIRTLNFRVGAYRNYSPQYGFTTGCEPKYVLSRRSRDRYDATQPDGNSKSYFLYTRQHYWTVSQCTNTNTGGGLFVARNVLQDPSWIRRDAIWTIVLLTDGYPNRTPAVSETSADLLSNNSDVYPHQGANSVDSQLQYRVVDAERSPLVGPLDQYCLQSNWEPYFVAGPPYADGNDPYGKKPWLCTGYNAPGTYAQMLTRPPQYSYGFCPQTTYCDVAGAEPDPTNPNFRTCKYGGNANDPNDGVPVAPKDLAFWSYSATGQDANPCVDNDPNSRHFCMNDTGVVNRRTNDSGGIFYCDPNYDPDDYARDQADWAGLITYGDGVQGQFIAMFTIFFAHNEGAKATNIGSDILGVKMLRYVADAGDNGVIDNNLQEFYRYYRNDAIRTFPVSGYGGIMAIAESQGIAIPKGSPSGYAQFRWYKRGTDIYSQLGSPDWMTRTQDECTLNYDYVEKGDAYSAGSAAYELWARSDCGQYWYADEISKVNRAFTEIAGRLFTRLSR